MRWLDLVVPAAAGAAAASIGWISAGIVGWLLLWGDTDAERAFAWWYWVFPLGLAALGAGIAVWVRARRDARRQPT